MGKFTELIDPDKLTVLHAPDFVFLCGAQLNDPEHSLRDLFFERKVKPDPKLLARVKLAEDAERWYRSHEHFDDLLELEEYLAGLSACVLLFVESPGAIAELGVFSQMPILQDKLLVVLEQSHSLGPSFIVDGPIKQMKRNNFGTVLSFPWLTNSEAMGRRPINTEIVGETLDAIAEELDKKLQGRPKTVKFRDPDHGHRMLLVADLVKLSGVCNRTELHEILQELSLNYTGSELKRYLFLLDQLKIIATKPYGNVDYYFGNDEVPDHISYAAKVSKTPDATKVPIDRLRLRELLRSDYGLSDAKRRALNAHNIDTKGAR